MDAEALLLSGQALRVQDIMILRIIKDANWRVPIYFAVTVSQSNRIGLDFLFRYARFNISAKKP